MRAIMRGAVFDKKSLWAWVVEILKSLRTNVSFGRREGVSNGIR